MNATVRLSLALSGLLCLSSLAAAQVKSSTGTLPSPKPAPAAPKGGAKTTPAPAPSKPGTPSAPAKTPAKQHPKATRRGFVGTVASVDLAGKTLKVSKAKNEQTFTLSDATRVTVDKKAGKLSDIANGQNVKVVYEIDSKKAVLVEIKTK